MPFVRYLHRRGHERFSRDDAWNLFPLPMDGFIIPCDDRLRHAHAVIRLFGRRPSQAM